MKIFAWGSNSHGQLGQGVKSEQSLYPQEIDCDVNVKSIIGGGKHTILIAEGGALFSCGDNSQGQLSQDQSVKSHLSFQPINFAIQIAKVCCGWDFNLALSEEGIVFGWGGNSFGQLGLPHKKGSFLCVPHKIFPDKAIDIGAGLRHSVIVTEKGSVFTAGSCKKGQLGIRTTVNRKYLDSFTQVSTIQNARKISCGENHCVLQAEENIIFAWGDNKFGQLAVNPTFMSHSEVPIVIDCLDECAKINELASGWSHNAILTDKGRVFLWGRNDYGQLAESRVENWRPKCVKSLNGTCQIVLGSNHGVALKFNCEILCWGWNEHGNCGNGNCENVSEPTVINTFGLRPKLIGTGSAHNFFCTN